MYVTVVQNVDISVRWWLIITGVAQQGVPETWIIEHIRGRERFQSVPIARIRSALVGLEEASELFSISKGVYKTIT